MKEKEIVYGIQVSYKVDELHRADIDIPIGVRIVEDDPKSKFFKVYDKDNNCIFGVEKSRIISWIKGYNLDEEEIDDEE